MTAAEIRVSWPVGRSTVSGRVVVDVEGIEVDEVVDALLAGLAATDGRVYTIEAAEVVEEVRRPPASVYGVRPVVARPVRGRPERPPVTPDPGAPEKAIQDVPSSPVTPAPAPPGSGGPPKTVR